MALDPQRIASQLLDLQQKIECAGLVVVIMNSKDDTYVLAVSDKDVIEDPIELAIQTLHKAKANER